MNLVLGFVVGGVLGVLIGAYMGTRAFTMWRISVFRDLDHLVGMIREICSHTHDRRIAPQVVIDRLNELKYGLHLPDWIEREYDENPA